MNPSPSCHPSFASYWFQDSFLLSFPLLPFSSLTTFGRSDPFNRVLWATCETVCSYREIILQWPHKSRHLLDAANQWEHQDLYSALRKSRASIRQTNHAAGICVMKSTLLGGQKWCKSTTHHRVGQIHPVSPYSLPSCSLLGHLNI